MRRVLVALAVVAALSEVGSARDRLVVQLPDKSGPITFSGDVADYTAEVVEIHLTVGNPIHRYPASQVVAVETVQTNAHREGVRLFREGELAAARERFEQALSDEPRNWVKREILGWLIKIAMREGNRSLAIQRFLQIVAGEAAPREYALAPLVWGASDVDEGLRQQARFWLTGPTDVERLFGASVLLLDSRFAETAGAELEKLARVADTRVAALARTQLWRLRVTAADLTDNEIAAWETTIERLPTELRAGPYFVLGRASHQRSEYDRAAAAYLWLPTVYHEEESLTARAAIGAATALKRIGRLEEAHSLLMELTRDYGWSPAATEAKTLLGELNSPPE